MKSLANIFRQVLNQIKKHRRFVAIHASHESGKITHCQEQSLPTLGGLDVDASGLVKVSVQNASNGKTVEQLPKGWVSIPLRDFGAFMHGRKAKACNPTTTI